MALVPIAPASFHCRCMRAAAAVAEPAVEAADLGEGAQQHGADVVGQRLARVEALGRDVREHLGEELVVAAVRAVDRVLRW